MNKISRINFCSNNNILGIYKLSNNYNINRKYLIMLLLAEELTIEELMLIEVD